MSTKTTGRRTPLSLSGTSTGKMNPKPSTPSNLTVDNNRNKDNTAIQKTESDKAIKDVQQKDKKTSSSPQLDNKTSQNGVSNGSGTPTNQTPTKSDNENKSKQEKVADKGNKSQQQQQQQNASGQKSSSSSTEKEKASKKDENSAAAAADVDKTPRKNRLNKPDLNNSINSESTENGAKTPVTNDEKIDNKSVTENSAANENINGASTPTRNRRKHDATPDKKTTKQNEDLKGSTGNTKSISALATPKKSDAAKDKPQVEIPTIDITDEVEMTEPLLVDPITATSTPGKIIKPKIGPPILSENISSTTYSSCNSSPDRKPERNYGRLTISGRRSIRPINDDYPFMQGNYRKSEFDATSTTTNTSLNVTVGSEVANSSFSFSFFGRGRKRDRNPTNIRSEPELMEDNETSPKSPKRARVDVSGFFSAVASPLTKLRARFSRASIQSSTPMKEKQTIVETSFEENINNEKPADISIDNDVQFHSENDMTVGKEEVPTAAAAVAAPPPPTEQDTAANESKTSCQNDEASQPKIEIQNNKDEPPTSDAQPVPFADSTDDIMITITPAGEKKRSNCIVM